MVLSLRPRVDQRASAPTRALLLLCITMASAVGMVASSIYVPSIVTMASAFATPVGTVQLSFVAYLAAMAAGMLLLGPLSDALGRRRVMLAGLCLCIAGSIICALSPTVELFIAARFLQGLGASAGSVAGRAVIRDAYGKQAAARVIAWIAFSVTVIQCAAPLIGGEITATAGWRLDFVAVLFLALVTLGLATRVLPRPTADTVGAADVAAAFHGYRSLLGHRRFIAYAVAATGAHAGFHIFSAGAPAIFAANFGVTPQSYGLYAFLPPLGFLLGSSLCGVWQQGIDKMVLVGGSLILQGGLLMLALALTGGAGPLTVVGLMALICCGSGMVTPNAIAGALSVLPDRAGAASGLTTFCQLSGAAGATAVLAWLPSDSLVILSAVIFAVGAIGVLGYAVLIHCHRAARDVGFATP